MEDAGSTVRLISCTEVLAEVLQSCYNQFTKKSWSVRTTLFVLKPTLFDREPDVSTGSKSPVRGLTEG